VKKGLYENKFKTKYSRNGENVVFIPYLVKKGLYENKFKTKYNRNGENVVFIPYLVKKGLYENMNIQGTEKATVLLIHNLSEKLLSLRDAISDSVRVYAVKSGSSAMLTLEKTENIKLIVLDLEMPVMSGYEFLDYLTVSGKYKDIPVLVITESPQHEITAALKRYGNVAGVIGKPCDIREFREITAEVLGFGVSIIEKEEAPC
jgi:CheY-like chemotaxis protein